MRKGSKASPALRAKKARLTAQNVYARELLMARILTRLWPSYVTDWDNQDYPYLLCVGSPIGRLVWRLSESERQLFADFVVNERKDEWPHDRTPTLQALAEHGWPSKS